MGSVKEDIDKEIDYLAHEIVVPITGEPTQPYEFDALKKYKAELGLFADHIVALVCKRIEGAMLEPERRVKVTDKALKAHYRETMETSRVPSDYMLMMTEGGDADAVAYANCFTQLQAILDVISPTGGKIG